MTGFERINPAVVSRNPETTTDVVTPPKRCTIHSEDRGLAAGRTTRCVVRAVWVFGDTPYRIRTFKREECLGNVGLDERYATGFSDELNNLGRRDVSPSRSE